MDREKEPSQLILEMEDTVNRFFPTVNFKYPEDYLDYDVAFGLTGWMFPKGRLFIQDCLSHLKTAFGIEDLVPFAVNGEKNKQEKHACFLIDGKSNDKVVTIHPSGTLDTICRQEYENVWDWYFSEMDITSLKERMMTNGKTKFLGLDMVDDAFGPLVAIPKRLIDGCRLVMTTDAGIWYAYNDDIKNTVETCGCGLRVLSVREIENENVEVIMEGITEDTEKSFNVYGEKIFPPEDTYILVTPFAGEYFVKLEAEDANGNREFLWGDDFIYK